MIINNSMIYVNLVIQWQAAVWEIGEKSEYLRWVAISVSPFSFPSNDVLKYYSSLEPVQTDYAN